MKQSQEMLYDDDDDAAAAVEENNTDMCPIETKYSLPKIKNFGQICARSNN